MTKSRVGSGRGFGVSVTKSNNDDLAELKQGDAALILRSNGSIEMAVYPGGIECPAAKVVMALRYRMVTEGGEPFIRGVLENYISAYQAAKAAEEAKETGVDTPPEETPLEATEV